MAYLDSTKWPAAALGVADVGVNYMGNDTLGGNVTLGLEPTAGGTGSNSTSGEPFNWGVLSLSLLIVATATGNVLVCLAVCWEKRLQNMTNYFLMSLAIADLLVALLVMPFGLIVELYGYFPLNPAICVFWATMDVLMCTASIWHMCTMSMDRYFTLKYPMKYGRNKTKTMVVLKIMFVWVVSISICCPLSIYGFTDYSHVYNDGLCVPTIEDFVMYGSIFAFYVPLFIMVLTYGLTIRILCKNQKLMQRLVSTHSNGAQVRKETNGGSQMYSRAFLRPPNFTRCPDRPSIDSFRPSIDTSISYRQSLDNSCSYNHSMMASMAECVADFKNTEAENSTHGTDQEDLTEKSIPAEDQKQNSGHVEIDQNEQFLNTLESSPMRSTLSVSQPHLPSMLKKERRLSKSCSRHSLRMTRNTSHLSVLELESVRNFEHLSTGGSLNSMLSQNHWDSTVWSDYDEPDMLDKLSQIEAEMDECLLLKKKAPVVQQGLGSEGGLSDYSSTESSDKQTDSCALLGDSNAAAAMNIPPVKISAPSGTNSDSSLGNSSSSKAELVTISLKPSGCYLYQVQYSKLDCPFSCSAHSLPTPTKELSATDDSLSRTQSIQSASAKCSPRQDSNDSTTSCLLQKDPSDNAERAEASDKDYGSTDECLSDGYSATQSTMSYYHSPNLQARFNPREQGVAGWNSFWKRRKARKIKRSKANGQVRQMISKRTASNEKKASKVLGIIFAVFIVLWTPFFIVNLLSVACKMCMSAMTPAMMASIVWLGYLSSLANPIIYTMFNTAFRRAFYKILTCKYWDPKSRNQDLHMTNMTTNWAANHTSDRRNTVTVTLRE